jgi:hypothetical protein
MMPTLAAHLHVPLMLPIVPDHARRTPEVHLQITYTGVTIKNRSINTSANLCGATNGLPKMMNGLDIA